MCSECTPETELLESAGKPFGTNHFKITSLTLNRQGIRIRIVEAEVPLSEMFGYTTELRSMSTGRASSVMEPLKYAPVPTQVKNAILEEVG